MKNSFILYVDTGQQIDTLPDDEAGALFKAIFHYVGEGIRPQNLSPAGAMAFGFIQMQIDRDTQKFEDTCRKRAEAGSKGGRKRAENAKQKQANQANAKSARRKQANQADNEHDNDNEINICVSAVRLLNDLSGGSFRTTTKTTQKLIAARIKDGYSLPDIETVIRHKCAVWGDSEKMRQYLRPETLFGNKFEGYLSDARRSEPKQEQGYVLAPLVDPFDAVMGGGGNV